MEIKKITGRGILITVPDKYPSEFHIGQILEHLDEKYEVRQIEGSRYLLSSLPEVKGVGLVVRKL